MSAFEVAIWEEAKVTAGRQNVSIVAEQLFRVTSLIPFPQRFNCSKLLLTRVRASEGGRRKA